jgi:hypothetical protein
MFLLVPDRSGHDRRKRKPGAMRFSLGDGWALVEALVGTGIGSLYAVRHRSIVAPDEAQSCAVDHMIFRVGPATYAVERHLATLHASLPEAHVSRGCKRKQTPLLFGRNAFEYLLQ